MRLAQLHFERGEVDRACAVLVRALAARLPPAPILGMLDAMPEAHSPEGEFHRLQARAQAYELAGKERHLLARVAPEYGAALWDLAGDHAGRGGVVAVAAELGGSQGWFDFACDLVEVLGLERAIDEVAGSPRAAKLPSRSRRCSRAPPWSLQSRRPAPRPTARDARSRTDPANVWALEIVESSALAADMPAVESVYRAALGATLGAYGERALHYRAARFFERAGRSAASALARDIRPFARCLRKG